MDSLSAEKHTAILDGAARIFAERGYEGASMSMITAAAGVSKGTIYQHFEGKAALFGAAVARECEAMLADVFQPSLVASPSGAICLRTLLTEVGRRLLALILSPKAMAMERIVAAEAARFPELAKVFFEAGPARGVAAMAALLSAQVAAGRLNLPDPAFAGEQFFMLCQTRVAMRARLGFGFTEAEAEHVVDEAVRMFLAAYGVDETIEVLATCGG